jgi:spermidine synthase
MLALYTVTMFFSAALMFSVQPLFARLALPLLGGSPSVWNTALVFYQATLLAGYLYAHVSTRLLGVRRQALLHTAVLLVPFLVLPIGIAPDWTPPTDANPIPWLLALLAAIVGLPFFAVSATAPLLQQWFAALRLPSSGDPYFLYAASNAGSFFALLAYPLTVEPLISLSVQARWWTFGYAILVLLIGVSALSLRRVTDPVPAVRKAGVSSTLRDWLPRRLRWLLLALIPSSLMVAVTTHVSMELAAIPLLWIVPLSIYLLTFVLVFARRPPSHRFFVRALPIVALAVTYTLVLKASEPLGFVLALHLVLLFAAAMVCHGELARDRPPADDLTEFYLWMAGGGVLGGMFNALVAPLMFRSVVEYPLMMVAALLVAPLGRPGPATAKEDESAAPGWRARSATMSSVVLDVALAAAVAVLTVALVAAMERTDLMPRTKSLIAFGVPALLTFRFSRRSLRCALSIAAILIVSAHAGESQGQVLHAERTFFGVHRVTIESTGAFRQLLHGRTMHGRQSLSPDQRHEPIGYYGRSGPVGQLFTIVRRPARVAVVGLGNGSLAAYAIPAEPWTFFEIDPAVQRIASDARWFTYLADAGGSIRIVLGDGRLSLARSVERYDVIFLDAYSSEAIPVHLLTREALQVYLSRLAPHGLIVFNTSNRHFNLVPAVAALAHDAALECRVRADPADDPSDVNHANTPSEWAVIARTAADLGSLVSDPRWQNVTRTTATVWTDDHSNILSALR